MCPDRDLVSAYIDGEVPNPWRERIEEHLSTCPDCAALASGYAALGERLRAELAWDEVATLARGRSRLEAVFDGMPSERSVAAPLLGRGESWRAWRRSVSLPLPLAAAAAILVILLSGATTLLALRPSKTASIRTVASAEIAPPKAVPASMDELLRYLDAREGQVTLTINLPSGTTFGSAGKPVIMRQAHIVRGTTVGGSPP